MTCIFKSIQAYIGKSDKRPSFFESVNIYALILFAFVLPWSQRASVLLVIIAVTNMILSQRIYTGWKYIFQNKLNYLFMGWYFLHIAGLLYSQNLHYAFSDLQTKLSFLIFPLVVFTSSLSQKQTRWILLAFTMGCLVACIACLMKAIGWYQYNHQLKYFTYSNYAFLLHPTYFTIYLNFTVLFLLSDMYDKWKSTDFFIKFVIILLCLFLLINITQLNARTASATAYMTILIYLVYIFYRAQLYLKGLLILLASVMFFGFLQYQVLQLNRGRLQQITDVIEHKTDQTKYNSTTLRIQLWKNAFELIREHPLFGVGIGDIKEELIKKYEKHGFTEGITAHYSPHNQYIHSTVIMGITGLVCLIMMLCIPLVMALRAHQWLYAGLLLIIIFNNLTESVMEVEKGVLFYAFFNSLGYNALVHMKKWSVPDENIFINNIK